MTYQEFKDQIYTNISNHYESRAGIHLSTYMKNNGVELDGLTIQKEGQRVSPTLYLNDFYPLLSQGQTMESITERLISAFEKPTALSGFCPDDLLDFSKIKSSVFFKLINRQSNETLLKDVPFFEYLDLAIVFCIMVTMEDQNWGSILIHNHMLEEWKLSKEELFDFAKVNTYQMFAPSFRPLEDVIENMLSEKDKALFPCLTPAFPMFILTNTQNAHGATVICYPDFLQKLSMELDTDFFILPSSIHEVILIPMKSEIHLSDLSEMVKEVNSTQLEPEEVLSDHAYYYMRSQNKVMY